MDLDQIRDQLHIIQRLTPPWLAAGGKEEELATLMAELPALIKAQHGDQANTLLHTIIRQLTLASSPPVPSSDPARSKP